MSRLLLDPKRPRRDFGVIANLQQPFEFASAEGSLPAFVGFAFVVALPVQVGLVLEAAGEKSLESAAGASSARMPAGAIWGCGLWPTRLRDAAGGFTR